MQLFFSKRFSKSAAYFNDSGFGYESFMRLSLGPERSPLANNSKNSEKICFGTFIEPFDTSKPLMKSNHSTLN